MDGTPGSSLLITNATLVLPDGLVEHGAVAIINGRIEEVGPAEVLRGGGLPVLDAAGAYCLPGLVNLHDDEIETEVNPRPGASLPLRFSRRNYIQRALGSGITTAFMAIAYADLSFAANPRTVQAALAVGDEIARDPRWGGLEQHLLPRFTIDRPEVLRDVVLPVLDRQPVRALAFLGSGYSRFKDQPELVERLRAIYPEPEGCSALAERYFSVTSADARAALLEADPHDLAPEELVPYLLCLVHREQQRAPFVLSTHDDETAAKVELMHAVGATICEMPVEVEAARRARDLGMWVSVGAPNITRGGSTRGRLAASDLVGEGLGDIIVADYHAPSLLYALFEVVRLGAADLVTATRLCSTNPADAIGMGDRGRIQPGARADLALVDLEDGLPVCHATLVQGLVRYSSDAVASPALVEVA